MGSSLINVRHDPERVHKVRVRRERGIRLSDVGREAIDERFLRLRTEQTTDAQTMIGKIFGHHPPPPPCLLANMMSTIGARPCRRATLCKLNPAK